MRERVFNVLGDRVVGTRVLDLYAGTGSVGLEALSRGAAEVVFVERHRAAARLIAENCEALGADDRTRVVVRPALAAMRMLGRGREVFELAWADPPFEIWAEGLRVLVEAFRAGVLDPAAVVCLECPDGADPGVSSELDVERDLKGGASRVVVMRFAGDPPGGGEEVRR
jgi:16S rRNA (guanine966-N2)-methyltransferase